MSGGGRSASGPSLPAATGGALSALALAQYSALAVMRWRAFRNGLRSTRGVLEATASGLSYVFYAIMGIGITFGLAAGAYFMTAKGQWELLPLLFWVVFSMWQVMPIAVASFQQQFDLNGLLRFPLGFQPFFVLHLIFGLIDVSSVLGCLGCLGIFIGVTLADPNLFGWTALALMAFVIFNVLLSRAIFAWLDRWLAQRRTREILSALFFLGLLSLQFLNPALYRSKHPREHTTAAAQAATEHRLAAVGAVQSWLPPGLAVLEMEDAAHGSPAPALGALGVLGLYALAAGFALTVRLSAEHRGESLSDAPGLRKVEKRAAAAPARKAISIGGSGPIAAVIAKDLRVVMRSLPLLYAVFVPLIMVVVLAGLMGRSRHGFDHPSVAMPLCVVYALLGFTQLIYNNLGAEGAAVQLLFLSPTPMRTVFLAKNIFHALLFGLIAGAAGVLASLRLGAPTAAWLAVTVAWLLFALPAHLAVGNIFSLTMPHRINLSRIGRQRGAQATAMLGVLVQLAVLGAGAVTAGVCGALGHLWLAAPILLLLAVPACLAWLRVLANAESMANRRREELIATLVKAD